MGERTQFRSTTLRLVEENCLHALELYEAGAYYDRSVFDRGTAAHAILQAAGEESAKLGRQLTEDERVDLARATVNLLATKGRRFEGEPEPPLDHTMCREGADLALAWLEEHGDPQGKFEVGLAIDENGEPCAYEDAYFRGILDHYYTESDGLLSYLVKPDYKSSWAAGPAMVDGLQQRSQVVLAHAHRITEGHDEIRYGIANLRTRNLYLQSLYLSTSDESVIDGWREDLLSFCRAIDNARSPTGGLPATPGPRCFGCPYLGGSCAAANAYLRAEVIPDTPEERARLLAVHEAMVAKLKPLLKLDTDGAPVEVDGSALGTHEKVSETPAEWAYLDIAEAWEKEGAGLPALLMQIGLTKANIQKLARALHPGDTAAQAAWMEPFLETKVGSRFEWRKVE